MRVYNLKCRCVSKGQFIVCLLSCLLSFFVNALNIYFFKSCYFFIKSNSTTNKLVWLPPPPPCSYVYCRTTKKKIAKNGSKLSRRKNWRSVTLHSFNTISCVPQTWCIDFSFVRTVPLYFFNTFRIS